MVIKRYNHIEDINEFIEHEIMHSHIEYIKVFTGDDDYNNTACVKITSSNKNNKGVLNIESSYDTKTDNTSRIRYETGVKFFLKSEQGSENDKTLIVAHHKGGIFISLEKGEVL